MKKAFTLVELGIYMGLFAVFLLVLTELFVSVLDAQTTTEALSSVAMDGRFINNRLFYDLARGKTITTPASLGTATTSLTFTDVDNRTITYALSGDNLQETIAGAIHQLNQFDVIVSNLTFTRLGNGLGKEDTVKVSYTLTSTAKRDGGGREVQTFDTTFGLRPN
jgi:type II secretory pathway pseudopilin PulG